MDGAGVAGGGVAEASLAVTVTEPVVPAVTEAGVAVRISVAAAAGLTVMPALVPVIEPVTVSVAVIGARAGGLERVRVEKVWVPASPPTKV